MMLSGVMLIIVTMFAVLGAYYLSDVLTACIFKTNHLQKAVVVLPADSLEEMWNGVLDLRRRLPDTAVVVLTNAQSEKTAELEPGLQNVAFATPETVGETVCETLAVLQEHHR